ncbi:MAG: 4-alpha-glucanotransferase [Thermodesulfobacteria bacterium]|nr:4-alpha-glucanotransferase [Thermodesulfobacteriota bacterium]
MSPEKVLFPYEKVRRCGILLHISSLPGRFGIGQLGEEAEAFLQFLSGAGQSIWQFLPLGPTKSDLDHSPYMSSSAFAGNPLFISPDLLLKQGLLNEEDLAEVPEFSPYLVEFERVEPYLFSLLNRAFKNFSNSTSTESFQSFCQKNSHWLDDYALFMSLKEKYNEKPWYDWPDAMARRHPDALEGAAQELSSTVLFHKFTQWQFFSQWDAFKSKAQELGVRLFGDIPIYVAADSADVWANQDCFELDPVTLKPKYVAGVPPDYFSKTGQRWGNPIYKWKINGQPNPALYRWWSNRLSHMRNLLHILRIDHFRGFQAYWQIPASEPTAIKGKWVRGPGRFFFEQMKDAVEGLEIVAEDLGTITRPVIRLREELGLAGMKVLMFAFDSDEKNLYLPHNYEHTNFYVYSGTHDNNTAVGWYLDPQVPEYAKARIRRYANSDGNRIHWDFLRLAYSSVARTAIMPMQDVLGFGSDCRMNTPATSKGNWRWRLAERFITQQIKEALFSEAKFYARIPDRKDSPKA